MESFDSYVGGGEDLQGTRPFDGDDYTGYDPRLASQRFESFGMPEDGYGGEDQYISSQNRDLGGGEFEDGEDAFSTVKRGSSNGGFDAAPVYQSTFDDDIGDGQHSPAMSSPFGQSFESRLHSEFTPADEFSPSVDSNGKGFESGFGNGGLDSMYGYAPNGSIDGAVLPPPDEMQAEEGFILREWKRQNAIRLEEKARLEREKLSQIIDAADAYKEEFYAKRRTHCETNQKNNRDKEKVFLENQVTFHATADKQYWKAVGELIPNELPTLEAKSRGKDKKKPSVVINHGPKPGKATDLTRMRHVLVKLKHNPPEHMKPKPPPPQPPAPAAGAPGAEGADGKQPPAAAAAAAAAAPADPAPLEKQGSNPPVVAAA